MKDYIVVYLSDGGMHYRFRCTAKNKKDARYKCHIGMGVPCKEIVDCYEDYRQYKEACAHNDKLRKEIAKYRKLIEERGA